MRWPIAGSTAAHLAADDFGEPADLAADSDLEPIGIVVATIALVGMDAACREPGEFFRDRR